MNGLKKKFEKYFEVVPANTPRLLDESFRLRYQVYCEEHIFPGFEADRFPKGRERDIYDDRSAHCLILHRPSGNFVGNVRLVLPDPSNPERPFPMEEYPEVLIDPELIDTTRLPRQNMAEISRLLFSKRVRSRENEHLTKFGSEQICTDQGRKDERRNFPHPILALAVATLRMALEHRITHFFSLMEPALSRLLKKLKFRFKPIGPIVEYHGQRQPYFGIVEEILDGIYKENHELWELIVEKEYAPVHYGFSDE